MRYDVKCCLTHSSGVRATKRFRSMSYILSPVLVRCMLNLHGGRFSGIKTYGSDFVEVYILRKFTQNILINKNRIQILWQQLRQ